MYKTFYLKAADDNHWRGGPSQWLKIRGFKALKDLHSKKEMYELEVKFSGIIQYMMIVDPYNTELKIKFKDEQGMPTPFLEVIRYFKDRGIGLLIS